MALFNRKKDNAGDDDSAKAEQKFVLEPIKARKWFDHAKSMADSSNYTSALVYYANGMKFDPTSIPTHEAMIKVALLHKQAGGKKAASKDIKGVDGPHPVHKLAAAELAWLSSYSNPSLAVKAVAAAVQAEQMELARYFTPLALKLVMSAKKVDRKQLLQMKDLSSAAGAWKKIRRTEGAEPILRCRSGRGAQGSHGPACDESGRIRKGGWQGGWLP